MRSEFSGLSSRKRFELIDTVAIDPAKFRDGYDLGEAAFRALQNDRLHLIRLSILLPASFRAGYDLAVNTSSAVTEFLEEANRVEGVADV